MNTVGCAGQGELCRMSDQGQPLLSVIVAAYNSAATLQQCLDSVISQTFDNAELIVIDGGSSDGSLELLRTHSRHIAYWVSEPDRGIYHAWNKALANARGEWVCFLGSDDYLWDEQVLARVASQLAQVPDDINVAYSQVNLVGVGGELLYPIGEPWLQVKERFKQLMCIPHPSVLHRRRLFREHGVFDESFRIAGDYELLLRELRSRDAFFMHGIVFSAMRQGGISSALGNTVAALREVRAAQRKNGLRWPGQVWLLAWIRARLRLLSWFVLGEKRTRVVLDWGRRLRGLPRHWTQT